MVQLGAGNTIITPKDLLIATCALLHFVFFCSWHLFGWKPEVSGTLVFSGVFSGLWMNSGSCTFTCFIWSHLGFK